MWSNKSAIAKCLMYWIFVFFSTLIIIKWKAVLIFICFIFFYTEFLCFVVDVQSNFYLFYIEKNFFYFSARSLSFSQFLPRSMTPWQSSQHDLYSFVIAIFDKSLFLHSVLWLFSLFIFICLLLFQHIFYVQFTKNSVVWNNISILFCYAQNNNDPFCIFAWIHFQRFQSIFVPYSDKCVSMLL